MEYINANQQLMARLSLSFLWVFTGVTSLFISPDIGYEILRAGNITGVLADFALYSGGLLDILIGVWLLQSRFLNFCYKIQLSVIIVYTFLITFIDYTFWFHPFGPITKNIPIVILIYLLMENKKV